MRLLDRCCDVEPVIIGSKLIVEGDNSPNTRTRVFTVLTMKCINPRCSNFNSTWEEKIEMKIGE